MKRSHVRLLFALLFGVVTTLGVIGAKMMDQVVEIAVSPSTLILNMTQQQGRIHVHAEIAYALVEKGSVELNGVAATSTFADSCGELVAIFPESKIEAMAKVPKMELTLEGLTKDGLLFTGTDVVAVINVKNPR